MVDYLIQKSFCRRTCLREARAIAERTRRPGATGLPARSVRTPRPGQRSAGAARLPCYAALASGPARVVLISTRALSSLSFSNIQPPGIDEGDVGDADEAEDVPDIGGSEIITAAERNAAGRNDDDGL